MTLSANSIVVLGAPVCDVLRNCLFVLALGMERNRCATLKELVLYLQLYSFILKWVFSQGLTMSLRL